MKSDIIKEVFTAKGLKVNEFFLVEIDPKEILGMPEPRGITIQYEKTRGMKVVVLEKTFPSQAILERWLDKNADTVKVLRSCVD